jgi:phosphoribosylamine--glycine ligase
VTVCVVGSGAREHALALALARSEDVVVAPGNPGTEGRSPQGQRITRRDASPLDVAADLFVIGPEQPLVDGLADQLRALGRVVLGPGADGARLEGSKAFMKRVCEEAGVPTARWGSFEEAEPAIAFLSSLPGPYVVKTDGLAAGKGVLVTEELGEAVADVRAKLAGESFGAAGRRVVVEEALFGPEVSLLVLCDGRRLVPLPPAQDHKRLGDGDTGPNTGGMGAYSPVPVAGSAVVDEIMERIVEPTVARLRRTGIEYRGVLYAGCMLTATGARLLEYNVRFGDPETEVVIGRVGGDVAALLRGAAEGRVRDLEPAPPSASVCVVLAAPGYPGSPETGAAIEGIEQAGTVEGVTVFHAGTCRDEQGVLRTAGGRVLAVTALAPDLPRARERAYLAAGRVGFDGVQMRGDVAASASAALGGAAGGAARR